MITVIAAKLTGDIFGKESIYDGLIRLNGYPFLDSKEEYHQNLHAGQVMTTSGDLTVLCASGNTVRSLENLIQNHTHKGFPVVISLDSMQLVGYINRK
jgi:chloride channel 3/4/5